VYRIGTEGAPGDKEAREGSGGPHYDITTLRQIPTGTAPEFPTDTLPKAAARLVKEGAAAIGCPEDFIGLSALTALGAAIGNARVIRPKKDWTEGAALYSAVIADPGEKKTAAVAVATGPARRLENRLNREYERELDEHAREMREYAVEERDARREDRAAMPPPKRPTAQRVYVNDTTTEALIPILKGNPRGVLLERDELVGWVKGMDQYKAGGKGADRQFWLSTWSNSRASVDRKGQNGEPLSVLRPFVGVLGAIQPTVLPELAEGREDGMLERFLFAYPDPVNALWTDDEISESTEAAYAELYRKLRELTLEADELGDPLDVAVAFSPDAKQVFVDSYNEHRREMAAPDLPRYLRSPWSKLEAYLVRLMLILAACRFVEDDTPERVEPVDVLKAVTLLDYFKSQARRVFGALRESDPRLPLLRDVARFVKDRGGLWTGTAAELHEELDSPHTPERPNELSRFIRQGAEKVNLLVTSDSESYKDEESGEWKARRVLTLYLPTSS